MPTSSESLGASEKISWCARGENVLQQALHECLGVQWVVDEAAGRAEGPSPHRFLFAGITLTPGAHSDLVADVDGDICDSFAAFTADALPSRTPEAGPIWMFRPPGPVTNQGWTIPGLRLHSVSTDEELDRWEDVSFLANGGERESAGELHPAGSQHDPRLRFFTAEIDGTTVGTGLAVLSPESVTISAVTVLPESRGRGIGRALTVAALESAPELPAVLSASELGLGVYKRLGFEELRRLRRWSRRESA
ncbi:MAG TPA: GNAT family N-acetyltransferase [Candidatus Agrococcus pullicola]|uniref:GNAT family N-acetyltransferase n=1 Tax=Candidatus Agrococcus pullicola TaxID=2838429 RepID=A0A9D1YVV8_9MICO|nr:GNAT family N-acetyltransferase [Candidatus Agrococcus pullicola]